MISSALRIKAAPIQSNLLGKCGPIFKILSPVDSYENSLYIPQRFPLHLQYVSILPCKIQKVMEESSVCLTEI